MTPQTYEDLFKLDSGLRETMDLTIVMAYFATHAEYQGGRVHLLFLTGFDEAGDEQEVRMSVGGDWSSADGGKTITHPTKSHINRNTIYGHFLTHAMEVPELRDALITQPGGPTTAAIWENLIIHLDLTSISFGRNLDPQERLMPTAFLGRYNSDAPAPPATPATPAPAPVASPVPPAQVPTVPTPPLPNVDTPATVPTATPTAPSPAELVAQARAQAAAQQANSGSPLYNEMVELAKASATFGDFMAAAFARADVLSDEELAVQVADDTAAGIFAQAHT